MALIDPGLEIETVDCEICLKEVPASEAQNEEAADYVVYFCGLECYARWKEQQGVEDQDK